MKTIELSLSPKYVSGWGVEEAVREILQNAIDQKADGAEVSVSYDRETLSILTDGARLKTSTLLLGESGKDDERYIEQFGYECWELDALDPSVISRLIDENVRMYRDEELYRDVLMRENEENRDIIEEMRVPCGPKGDKGYVGSDRAPAPDEHPANRVLPEEIAALMASAEFFDEKRYGNTTVVTAKLPNGWTITEQSACIDPDNYDHDLGVEICKKRIEDELWKLEGYRKVCERAVRDGEQG